MEELKEYTFFEDVYAVVRQIPKGRVTSYGAIAAYLGTKLKRPYGRLGHECCPSCHSKVPAQRVVNRNGMLTGRHHFATSTLMEELLKKEGIVVENDTVKNFDKKFWDPSAELGL